MKSQRALSRCPVLPTPCASRRQRFISIIALSFLLFLPMACGLKDPAERSIGEMALAEGSRLRAGLVHNSRTKAIEKYKEALPYWRSRGDLRQVSYTLKLIGDAYCEMGEFQQALCYYDQALQTCREAGDRSLEIEIFNGLSHANVYLGKNFEAEEYCRRALDLSIQIENRRGEAESLNNKGEIYYAIGDRQSALNYYLKALAISQDARDRRGQAQSLLYAGYVYSDRSEAQKAFDCYKQSLELWESLSEHRGRALTLVAIAHLQSKLGEKQEALNLYDRSLPLVRAVGDRYWEASVYLGMGFVYESMGESRTALTYHDRARNIYRTLGLRREEADSSIAIGEAYCSIGEYRRALDCFNEALSASRGLGDKKLESAVLKNIGSAYNSLGERARALKYFEDALAIHRAAGTKGGEISTLNNIGDIYRTSGQRKKAVERFKKALAISQAWCNLNGQARAHSFLAEIESDGGDLDQARRHIEESMNIAELLRTKVAVHELRASYFASIQGSFDLYIDLLMRQHHRRPSANLNALAFEQSERARARSLLEELTEARADFLRWGDPALIDRLQKLQAQINARAERRSQQLDAGAPENELMIAAKEISSLIIERDQVEAQIRAKRPHDPTLTQPQPARVGEIQRLLDDQTMLLEYELGEDRSYLWAVSRSELKSYVLPPRVEIEKVAIEVNKLLMTSSIDGLTNEQLEKRFWLKSSELSRMILGKAAGQLGKKRLLIVADGVLQYIPFQALSDPRTAKTVSHQPLMVDHEIVNLPSASTLVVLQSETAQRRPHTKTIAMLADPVFQKDDMRLIGAFKAQTRGLLAVSNPPASTRTSPGAPAPDSTWTGRNYRRLNWSNTEAEAVKTITTEAERLLLTGFEASRANALSPELSKYRIVHFATHGDLDTENPELSAIVLSFYNSRGERQEGYLRLHDIYNLNLPADLIVLSACETALGKEIKGEGLIGLTRGFMYAGASRVMSSLWKVEDQSTAALMKHFYKYLLIDKMTPAAALRQAQIAVRGQSRWRLPYHWAGFVLQGEWK